MKTTADRQWTAIDLFGGCGGLTAGLKRAGFRVVSAVECDPLAVATYKKNHPDVHVIQRRIQRVDSKELLVGGLRKVDLVAGCPPCQGFSRVRRRNGKRRKGDRRNGLMRQFQRVVEELRPTAVFMENVPGIERDFRFKRFLRRLNELGYTVTCNEVVELADHGVPQRRSRIVVLAARGFEITPPRALRKRRTVRQAIGSLPGPRQSRNQLHKLVTQHAPEILEKIRKVPKNGGSRLAWPDEWRLKCHKKCDGFKDVYGRMKWSEPAPTITGGCINASKGRFLHPRQNRVITLFEAALLQTFPRRYFFDLDRGRYAVAEMIGNALPPRFAERVGRSIKAALAAYCHGRRILSH